MLKNNHQWKSGEEKMKEVIIGNTKYIHKMGKDFDYLVDNSDNKIKVNLKFTKNKEKNEKAKDGLKTFFTELYS